MNTHLLEQIAAPENLLAAWRSVRGNIPKYRRQRTAGPDGVSLIDFEQDLHTQLSVLRNMLMKGRYKPSPPAFFTIPKRGGGRRMLAVLPVQDRVAQRATQQVLEGLWEPEFLPCSFGFRPGYSIEQAVGYVQERRTSGLRWVVDGDIATCFESMDHDILVSRVKQRVADTRVLALIQGWLDAGVMQAGPPQTVNMAAAVKKQKASKLVKRGVGMVLGTLADEINPYGRYEGDYEPLEPESWQEADEAGDDDEYKAGDLSTLYRPMRRTAIRQVISGGLLLGAGAVKSGITKLAPKVGEALKTTLSSPAGRRLLRKSAIVSGGLAGVAVVAAATAYILNKKAGKAPAGVLQGSPLSPLLANVYLHPFDVSLTQSGYQLARFADDWVVLCQDQDRAEAAYNDAVRSLARLRLKINQEKTRILRPEEKLEWLGVVLK